MKSPPRGSPKEGSLPLRPKARSAKGAYNSRVHRMPFGAQLNDDGSTQFRLWAPAAREVRVALRERSDTRDATADIASTASCDGPSRDGSSRDRSSRDVMSGDMWSDIILSRRSDGWFDGSTSDAPAGTRYAFRIDGKDPVPDPASRSNPLDAHGSSCVVDPCAYDWCDERWRGRRWEEAVLYELHVGTFTPKGTFAGVIERLDYLVDLGVTAIELMPVADFPGKRNWGYDGVLPFAPDAAYGAPDDLKRLVDEAHARSLMVLFDVVYNHFGPEGNYLHAYAPSFFNPAHHTPWGAAINFDGPHNRTVREFFIHNALYWLEEFHADGLRLDAVHAIIDDSPVHILTELTQTVRQHFGCDRSVHLIFENDHNESRYLERDAGAQPLLATAQWNDDVHHALHVIITGEVDGYYADYAGHPLQRLGRGLAEGFVYQQDWSALRSAERGAPSAHLPPLAFVNFLQNHDQIGNRAFGERITALAPADAVRAGVACLLLSPSPPLLFMGEEFAASTPFLFFCDFGPELAAAVTQGRRGEFGRFARFKDPAVRSGIPDPNAPGTFAASRLQWSELEEPAHRAWLDFYRRCLAVRREILTPRLGTLRGGAGQYRVVGTVLLVEWTFNDGAQWHLRANLSAESAHLPDAVDRDEISTGAEMRVVFDSAETGGVADDYLPPWNVRVMFSSAHHE